MNNFFQIVSSVSNYSSEVVTNDKDNILLLIWGQSNALGTATGAPGSPYEAPITGAKIDTGSTFDTLEFGVNNKANTSSDHGAELSFAKDYVSLTGRELFIAKEAVGGTPISQRAGDDWNVASNELINLIDTATNRLKTQSGTTTTKFVVYANIGEKDADRGAGDEYYQNMLDIMNYLNAIMPVDLFVLSALNTNISGYIDKELVRSEAIRFADEQPKAEYLDMLNYQLGGDGLHFTSDAQIQMGKDLLSICQTKFNL